MPAPAFEHIGNRADGWGPIVGRGDDDDDRHRREAGKKKKSLFRTALVEIAVPIQKDQREGKNVSAVLRDVLWNSLRSQKSHSQKPTTTYAWDPVYPIFRGEFSAYITGSRVQGCKLPNRSSKEWNQRTSLFI